MKYLKKITSVLLAACLMLSSAVCMVSAQGEIDQAALLKELNIMKGDPDGNMRLDDLITRAEFTKVAVAASKARNAVATSLTISPFKDVPYTHWAAPYIKTAVSNQICSGYPDGSFCPDQNVAYEEAVTMCLKVLGYTDSDFGVSWPYGQLGLAGNLEILDGINRGIGETMTRRDVVHLLYNTLDTKPKSGTVKYITTFDCQILEDVILIATTKEDPAVNSDKVVTSSGTFKKNDSFPYEYIGRKGDLVVKNGDEFISFTPYDQRITSYTVTDTIGSDMVLDGSILSMDENLTTYYKSQKQNYASAVNSAKVGFSFATYANAAGVVEYAVMIGKDQEVNTNYLEKFVVYSRLENKIIAYQDGKLSEIDILDTTTAYKEKQRSTFGALKATLSMGDLISVKRDVNGEIDYVSIADGNVDGPVTVKSADWANSFGNPSDVSYMRDGIKVSMQDIKVNDIVYYCKDLHMILAYNKKVTGVYEKALPNKDQPSSIVVSGVTYSLEGVNAFNAASSKGNFRFGDTVTLLMGKDNRVADIISPEAADVTGYVFETGKKEYTQSDLNTKYNAFYIRLALPDGSANEYITESNCEDYLNAVIRVNFQNGKAKVSKITDDKKEKGKFDYKNGKLGNEKLSADLKILDVTTRDSNETGNYTSVFPQRMDGINLKYDSVLYMKKDSSGGICEMILNNVTGDAYQYGVVTKAENSKNPYVTMGTYTYDIGGISNTIVSTNKMYSIRSGQPAKFTFRGNAVDSMQAINYLNETVEDIGYTSLTTKEGDYPLSDKVTVYTVSYDYDYMKIPLSEVIHQKDYQYSAYYDKLPENGGRIRIIIARKAR